MLHPVHRPPSSQLYRFYQQLKSPGIRRSTDYEFHAQGGMSWTVPYLAGMYALAVQVKPDITPEEFFSAAMEAGKTIPILHEGKEYHFGVILDPQALIEEIQGK